jgi:hypothetical protein
LRVNHIVGPDTGGVKKGKAPLSAYMHFSRIRRGDVKDEYPDATFGEVGKILGEWWQDASSVEKEKYHEMARIQREMHDGTYVENESRVS